MKIKNTNMPETPCVVTHRGRPTGGTSRAFFEEVYYENAIKARTWTQRTRRYFGSFQIFWIAGCAFDSQSNH